MSGPANGRLQAGPYVATQPVPGDHTAQRGAAGVGIVTLRGVDRLTGMSALVHLLPEGAASELLLPSLPSSPALLPVRELGRDGARRYAVSELPPMYVQASDARQAARGALTALAALHAAGLTHGGVSAAQLWLRRRAAPSDSRHQESGDVQLAGAGLPWGGAATPESDLHQLAAALKYLGGLPKELRGLRDGSLTAQAALKRLEQAEPGPSTAPGEAARTDAARTGAARSGTARTEATGAVRPASAAPVRPAPAQPTPPEQAAAQTDTPPLTSWKTAPNAAALRETLSGHVASEVPAARLPAAPLPATRLPAPTADSSEASSAVTTPTTQRTLTGTRPVAGEAAADSGAASAGKMGTGEVASGAASVEAAEARLPTSPPVASQPVSSQPTSDQPSANQPSSGGRARSLLAAGWARLRTFGSARGPAEVQAPSPVQGPSGLEAIPPVIPVPPVLPAPEPSGTFHPQAEPPEAEPTSAPTPAGSGPEQAAVQTSETQTPEANPPEVPTPAAPHLEESAASTPHQQALSLPATPPPLPEPDPVPENPASAPAAEEAEAQGALEPRPAPTSTAGGAVEAALAAAPAAELPAEPAAPKTPPVPDAGPEPGSFRSAETVIVIGEPETDGLLTVEPPPAQDYLDPPPAAAPSTPLSIPAGERMTLTAGAHTSGAASEDVPEPLLPGPLPSEPLLPEPSAVHPAAPGTEAEPLDEAAELAPLQAELLDLRVAQQRAELEGRFAEEASAAALLEPPVPLAPAETPHPAATLAEAAPGEAGAAAHSSSTPSDAPPSAPAPSSPPPSTRPPSIQKPPRPAPIRIGFGEVGEAPAAPAPDVLRRSGRSAAERDDPELAGVESMDAALPAVGEARSGGGAAAGRIDSVRTQPVRIGWEEDHSWRVVRTGELERAPSPLRRLRLPLALLAVLVLALGAYLLLAQRGLGGSAGNCCTVTFRVQSAQSGAVSSGAVSSGAGLSGAGQTVAVTVQQAPPGSPLKPGDSVGQAPGVLRFPDVPGQYLLRLTSPDHAALNAVVNVPSNEPVVINLR